MADRLRFRVVRTYPGGGLELSAEDDPRARVSAWTGPMPPWPPRHRGVGKPVLAGRLGEEKVWLESRPAGALLSELGVLGEGESALVFLELADAMGALHELGLEPAHVDADHVVVGVDGHAQWIGGAAPERGGEGLAALVEMLGDVWEYNPVGDDEPERIGEVAELLLRWVADALPAGAAIELGARAHAHGSAERLGDWVEVHPEGEAIDEVAVDLGPDPGSGLLDTWRGTDSGGTDWSQLTEIGREPTLAGFAPDAARLHRFAARLVASTASAPDRARFAAHEGSPCAAVKELIADEPLDPVPLPDGVPLRPAPGPDHATATGEVSLSSRTATRLTALSEEVSDRALFVAGLGAVLVVAATILLIYGLLGP